MAAKLHISLLGQVKMSLDGKALNGFVSSKAQALLCYVAVNQQVHSRDELAGLFWEDSAETDAKANLRVHLSNLRKLVGDHLLIDRQTVAVAPDALFLDSQVFENQFKAGDLKTAAELYQGDFMKGFFLPEVPLFEEWQVTERERLARLALNVF